MLFSLLPARAGDWAGIPKEAIVLEDGESNLSFYRKSFTEYQQRESATNCSNIDNRNAALGSVRKQGTVDWCYGFLAADLLSYALGTKVSAADASVNYYRTKYFHKNRSTEKDKPLSELAGGNIAATIRAALFNGICREDDIPMNKDAGTEYIQSLKYVEEILQHYRNTESSNKSPAEIAGCLYYPTISEKLFPQLSWEDFTAILTEDSSVKNKVFSFYDNACKGRKLFPQKKYAVRNFFLAIKAADGNSMSPSATIMGQGHNFFPMIDAALENKNIVGISVNSRAFFQNNLLPAEESHAMSIVGRRFNPETKQCNYLVRNSAGKNCSTTGNLYPCEEGNLLIAESFLKHSMRGITLLEEK